MDIRSAQAARSGPPAQSAQPARRGSTYLAGFAAAVMLLDMAGVLFYVNDAAARPTIPARVPIAAPKPLAGAPVTALRPAAPTHVAGLSVPEASAHPASEHVAPAVRALAPATPRMAALPAVPSSPPVQGRPSAPAGSAPHTVAPAPPSRPAPSTPPPKPAPRPAHPTPPPPPAQATPAPPAAQSNPAHSTPPSSAFQTACWSTSPDIAGCNAAALADIDHARQAEGLGPLPLPGGFYSMGAIQQVIAVSNAERTSRGLPAMPENQNLDAMAQSGAADGQDPTGPSGYSWASIYSLGNPTALSADYEWMYDDGPGGTNVDCSAGNNSGCWGHRDNILSPWAGQVGAGAATYSGRQALTALFVERYP